MKQYTVTGMSCAACSARVEKAVAKVAGVESCSVSLLTNSMGVEGTADPQAIIEAVEQAGYGAAPKEQVKSQGASSQAAAEEALKDHETPLLKKRLIASLCFLIPLMYLTMGHVMWGWPVPGILARNPLAIALIQLIVTSIVMVINQKFFISGFKTLFHLAPNMDTLVALGAGASYVYSLYVFFAMTNAYATGMGEHAAHYLHDFYFESAAMILTLITVGKTLEARSKGKTTDALKGLMKLAPKTAVLLQNGQEVEVPIAQVQTGDEFVVRPGENIPVDGVVLEGHSAINEAALTGESIPVDKEPGDTVSAATVNQSGFIHCRATRVGEDTTLSQIIQMVSDAAATKAPIAKVADKVSGVFVPVVIVIAIVTTLVWLLVGQTIGFALARGISVLVISCPCALGLATPVAIMVGNGMGAKHGIMFKTAVSLEETGKMQIVALDKTGTITKGEPQVTDLLPAQGITEGELLNYAYALESKSEHPLAKAILQMGQTRELEARQVSDFKALPGNGLTATLEGKALAGGNASFMQTVTSISETIKTQAEAMADQGKTPLYFAIDQKLLGIIAVADVMKEDSPQAIRELQNMGIRVVMLTGDNEKTANAIGKLAGVDQVIAGVLPEGKEQVIRQLKETGKVAMVGDGINDAPALTRADMGIAIGAGTDVAIDAADVVLMKSRLRDVPAAIRLSRAVLKNIHENLFWAFIYNIIGIPLAAGIWIPLFGLQLNPMFGAAAMSLSSFCVVSNALRLNWLKMYDPRRDKKLKSSAEKMQAEEETQDVQTKEAQAAQSKETQTQETQTTQATEPTKQESNKKEETKMEKTMTIEGMMCGHCSGRVKTALEGLSEVSSAQVSHETGTAVVSLTNEISDDMLKSTVEEQGYKVTSIQ